MYKQVIALSLSVLLCAGCTSQGFNQSVGTPKNPTSPFTKVSSAASASDLEVETIEKWYAVLASANAAEYDVPEESMRPYVAAGFAISDFYCQRFFIKTDESYRRRSFGRAATNDVGTVVQSILGLANAGKDAITGIGLATGLADSTWRQYDTAFLISADLSNVQSLVHASQDNFRARSLGSDATLPADYSTAQSVIMRYANICSFLGMQSLLNRSASQRRDQLNEQTRNLNDSQSDGDQADATIPASPDADGALGDPALTPNTPEDVSEQKTATTAVFVGRWGTSGVRSTWSAIALKAVADLGADLTKADFVPADIAFYCPAYPQLTSEDRQLFWAALLSSLAKRESSFSPLVKFVETNILDANGNSVVSRGLLQISQESANSYNCGISDAEQLHDVTTNLRCGVRILNRQVSKAGSIATRLNGRWVGAASYWSPFRKEDAREDVGKWVRSQTYCTI